MWKREVFSQQMFVCSGSFSLVHTRVLAASDLHQTVLIPDVPVALCLQIPVGMLR